MGVRGGCGGGGGGGEDGALDGGGLVLGCGAERYRCLWYKYIA